MTNTPDAMTELLDRIHRAPARDAYEAQMKSELEGFAREVVDELTALRARHAALVEAHDQELKIAADYAQIDGAHHKAWTLDQRRRWPKRWTRPNPAEYDRWIVDYCAGEDGPLTYTWDEGIPP